MRFALRSLCFAARYSLSPALRAGLPLRGTAPQRSRNKPSKTITLIMLPNQSKKKGLTATLVAISFVIALLEQANAVSEDGRVDFGEVLGFIPNLSKLPEVIKNADQIVAEIKDLDTQERHQLELEIAARFDLKNDRVEKIVENATAVLLSISQLSFSIAEQKA